MTVREGDRPLRRPTRGRRTGDACATKATRGRRMRENAEGGAARAGRSIRHSHVQTTFAYYGKGKSRGKGKRRASGAGLGRQGDPVGPGGNQLTCHECGPTEHFVGNCPRRQRAGRQMFVGTCAPTATSTSSSSTPLASLADLDFRGQISKRLFWEAIVYLR